MEQTLQALIDMLSAFSGIAAFLAAIYWGRSAAVKLPTLASAGMANSTGTEEREFATAVRKAAMLSKWGAGFAAAAATCKVAAAVLTWAART